MPILADHPALFARESLLEHGVKIAVIVAAAFVALLVARLAVRRVQKRIEGAESLTQELDLQRTATLTQALSYVFRVAIYTLAVLLVLGEVGLDLGPLIAGAGIVGVALGFGAQTLVRDFLSGFFILLENQYGVADSVVINAGGQQVTGKVEALNLRTTQVRAFDGTLNTIPNGVIVVVANKSRGWARAIVDVSVAYAEDVGRARAVLEELFGELRRDDGLREALIDGPHVLGVEQLGEKEVVLRVVAETRPSRRPDLERELRARIKERLEDRGVKVPATS